MTEPQPLNTPTTGCAAWAQPSQLPVDAQPLHAEATWCVILALASDVLWSASGRRWRNVIASETVTLDPVTRSCLPDRWGYRRLWCCAPGTPDRVRLPRPDVTAITAVTLNGAPFTSYRLASGSWAVRTDGMGWPLSPTTLITYTFGQMVPLPGRLAAILLATELGKALAGKACGLPARVTSVVRQGVSFDMLESLELIKEGLTGVHGVDLWLRTGNPKKTTQAGQVMSLDTIEARRA